MTGVQGDEGVLVVIDTATVEIGESLREKARRFLAEVVLAVMDERATDGAEPLRSLILPAIRVAL